MKHKTAAALLAALCFQLPLSAFADSGSGVSDGGEKAEAAGKKQETAKKNKKEESAKALKFPVSVRSENEMLKEMVETHLPLITQQQEEELDAEQMEFLAEEAPDQIKSMVRTKGYFNAGIKVAKEGTGYGVDIKPGVPAKIDNVSVAITGDILQDEDLADYYRNAMENWAQPVGAQFDQDNWSSSKTSVLAAVKRKKYPLASFSHTQATVNPAKNDVDLAVNVDSNKPVFFGDIQVEGVKRYPESVVRGMAEFEAGSPYDLDKLLDYQQALEQDSHYSGASVQADFDNLQGDRVPVKVTVSEVKKQKLELGLRYDSEYGPGGRIAYDYYDLFGKGYVGSVVADADKYETAVSAGISQPRNSDGHFWTSNMGYKRSSSQNLEKNELNGGVWFVRDRNGIEARLGLEYIGEKARIPQTNTDLGRAYATMLIASWKKQDIDTLLRPENGYYLDAKLGTTLGKLASSSAMQRIEGRAGYFFTPEDKSLGTFIARGHLGYVRTGEADDVPTGLMFRTGGAMSVRGYELNSIGRHLNGAVLPDRALAVGSLEYQYPITKDFSAAVFHDVGGVAQNFKEMKYEHGSGVGVRWFSPVAPFSFDIAYGHNDKKIRWHISLGTRF
ncbi:MAG: autotransporter assembly complex family protein [Neisseria sp.]|nr:autotransporter assembly complex family protein [Neisseria sp.]